jgi:hypothetical protein
MRPQRARKPQLHRRILLIQWEGQETEPNYLDAFCRSPDVRDRFTITVKGGEGKVATATINAAIQERNRQRIRGEAYDEVWCVLDVEDPSRRDNLHQAIQMAQKEGFTLFLSNPCFEVWLIAHFERTSRAFLDGKQAEAHLQHAHWRSHFGCDYDKNDSHVYQRLSSRLDTAVANAESVLEKHHQQRSSKDANSSTDVYRLIRALRTL